ncbi:MAG: dihydrodipicolinate synthase family protein [Fimbriimonadales bacterium]|nr:dihydrodipicolinate synthase family protein [Fimbriimonadales bacterium]
MAGFWAPMPTPFTDDGAALSEIRLARLVRALLQLPIEGIVVASDAGEFWALSVTERKTLLEMCLREVRGAVPLWCHVSSLRTATSLDLAQHAERHGAAAVMLMPPLYGTYDEAELVEHFHYVRQYLEIPVLGLDPQRRLSEQVRRRIVEQVGIEFADPVPWLVELAQTKAVASSDSFQAGRAVCTPLAWTLQADRQPNTMSRAWLESELHWRKVGSARYGKWLFASRSIELGPPRRPHLDWAGPEA